MAKWFFVLCRRLVIIFIFLFLREKHLTNDLFEVIIYTTGGEIPETKKWGGNPEKNKNGERR